jgi:hypothetical protein
LDYNIISVWKLSKFPVTPLVTTPSYPEETTRQLSDLIRRPVFACFVSLLVDGSTSWTAAPPAEFAVAAVRIIVNNETIRYP